MKQLIILSFIAVALITAMSCNKLDQDRYGAEVPVTQYYKTLEQCNTSVQQAYSLVDYNTWWEMGNWRFLSGEAASDNGWTGNTYQDTHPFYNAVAEYTLNSSNDRNEAQWIQLYKSIGRFNSMIEGIEGAPIDENSKKQFLSELKFLRAWCYFSLVRDYGGVPLVLKVYPPDTHLPRSTRKEVYDQVIADLLEASSVLPKKSAYPAADKFRASSGAAWTLLAKTYLYVEDWQNAEKAANMVITSGEYDLEPFFGTLWGYDYKNGQESVFEIQFGSSAISSPNYIHNDFIKMLDSRAYGGWSYYTLSSDLENAFKSEADSIRLQWTMNRHGMPVAGDPDRPKFNAEPWPNNGVRPSSKSGRHSRKHYVPVADKPANGLPSLNDKILRFADVLLIHAEACAMQPGKEAQALASLKRVRDRVDLTTNMSLTGWNLIDAVRKERRLELAFEGDRLYDIRRWKDQSGQPVINRILGPNGSFVTYNTKESTDVWEKNNVYEPQNKGANFNPSIHLVWPIPNSQIIISEGAVEQNPGY